MNKIPDVEAGQEYGWQEYPDIQRHFSAQTVENTCLILHFGQTPWVRLRLQTGYHTVLHAAEKLTVALD